MEPGADVPVSDFGREALIMARKASTGGNLFATDTEAIKTLLADANQRLLERTDDLLAAYSRVPESLSSDDEIAKARRFARQLDQAGKDARSARLADGRPFREATATVKALLLACDKHLADHGPHHLAGAAYHEVAEFD